MVKLLHVQKMEQIKLTLEAKIKSILKTEIINTDEALNFYIAEDVYTVENVPSFNKSRVDGYAVKFNDCKVASESSPCMLNYIGELNIGSENRTLLGDNECMYIPTGAMLPVNADAMVMIEHTEKLGDSHVFVNKSVKLNQYITFIGDDVKENTLLIKKGVKIDERVIAVLNSQGITKVEVFSKLKVCVLSSGDELVEPSKSTMTVGQTREINSVYCANALKQNNFDLLAIDLIKDDKQLYKETLEKMIDKYKPEIIITSGGSSKGDKDFTVQVFEELTNNVFCEGILLKPGKPTILANTKETLFIGLPGHPVSSYLVLKHLVLESFYNAIGFKNKNKVYGELSENVPNSVGRENIVLCNTSVENLEVKVTPVYYSSSNIGVLSQVDGYFVLSENLEGKNKGEKVEVNLF